MTRFQKAVRAKAYIKLGITGTSGAGKTYSSLLLARGLVGREGRIAVIDTENNSSTLYDNLTDFDQCEVVPRSSGSFHYQDFIDSVIEAERAGYDCVIIDSASHLWQAILDAKQELDKKPGGNSFTNWASAGKDFNAAVQTILQCRMHVIACMRSKTEFVLNESRKVEKKGLSPVMRDGIEYEFTTVFDIDHTHKATATKDRTGLFVRDGAFLIDQSTGEKIARWIDGGMTVSDKKNIAKLIRKQVVGNGEMTATVKSLCNGQKLEELPESTLATIAQTVGLSV